MIAISGEVLFEQHWTLDAWRCTGSFRHLRHHTTMTIWWACLAMQGRTRAPGSASQAARWTRRSKGFGRLAGSVRYTESALPVRTSKVADTSLRCGPESAIPDGKTPHKALQKSQNIRIAGIP